LRRYHIVFPSHLIFDSFAIIFHLSTQYKEHPLSWQELGAK
jgi:glutathione S-transferase